MIDDSGNGHSILPRPAFIKRERRLQSYRIVGRSRRAHMKYFHVAMCSALLRHARAWGMYPGKLLGRQPAEI